VEEGASGREIRSEVERGGKQEGKNGGREGRKRRRLGSKEKGVRWIWDGGVRDRDRKGRKQRDREG
jgi:hypothetical protein